MTEASPAGQRLVPPKPPSRADRVSLWRYLRLFRRDILSAQPARLYRARMAAFRTPFFRSFLVLEPALIDTVLRDRPQDFPKSPRVGAGLAPMLGASVFLANGSDWARRRRIIDPAFAGGRLHATLPALRGAAAAMRDRLAPGLHEIEAVASHAAADAMLRALFSRPIDDAAARAVFDAFRAYQATQPILNLAAFVALPRWVPRLHRPAAARAARRVRSLIGALVAERALEIAAGEAPDDLATRLMTATDPETGQRLGSGEMIDEVAIFFLAGHETSAAAIAWALYLLAADPGTQDAAAREVASLEPLAASIPELAGLAALRDVFRETLRLYPPVPMMVRRNVAAERFRDRDVPVGSEIVLSQWHLHRHERIWDSPDAFDPARWRTPEGQRQARAGYMPFSAGPRICPGAGFAGIEGVLMLATLLHAFRFAPDPARPPVPAAHLTVRSRTGIWLHVSPR